MVGCEWLHEFGSQQDRDMSNGPMEERGSSLPLRLLRGILTVAEEGRRDKAEEVEEGEYDRRAHIILRLRICDIEECVSILALIRSRCSRRTRSEEEHTEDTIEAEFDHRQIEASSLHSRSKDIADDECERIEEDEHTDGDEEFELTVIRPIKRHAAITDI
jgi:hypothetical protein